MAPYTAAWGPCAVPLHPFAPLATGVAPSHWGLLQAVSWGQAGQETRGCLRGQHSLLAQGWSGALRRDVGVAIAGLAPPWGRAHRQPATSPTTWAAPGHWAALACFPGDPTGLYPFWAPGFSCRPGPRGGQDPASCLSRSCDLGPEPRGFSKDFIHSLGRAAKGFVHPGSGRRLPGGRTG